MSTDQNARLSRAKQLFEDVKARYPQYQGLDNWTPAIFDSAEQRNELHDWLCEQGYKRGDKESRNDWLSPVRGLVVFRDSKVAVEAKLRFG